MLARLKLSTAVNPASASARKHRTADLAEAEHRHRRIARQVGHALHHQRLDPAGAALRQDAARAA